MEFRDILRQRRSTRRFITDRKVPREVVERLLDAAFAAPSARNSRSTRFMVVDDGRIIGRMAEMRDYGSAFLKSAPLAIVVAGEVSASPLWQVNASIAAAFVQLACVDEGLASCWVHVEGRPRLQTEPDGARAVGFLRELLPLPEGWDVLCVLAVGYSDFTPAALPPYDGRSQVVWIGGE